eukprot:TRINITY_DN114418_c0_g1_i1.p1 TRINITY_DN114418_c0_g1~~TRINITY_DN114418_c0_g1_i1.p1  ORF type:complete len:343 (+),score=90.99 TRINITY_DN114418_c0_g1_i1:114-1142(+)
MFGLEGDAFRQDRVPEPLQHRLAAQIAANEQLQAKLDSVLAEKEAAISACLAGAEAARVQMERMHGEIQMLRHMDGEERSRPNSAGGGPDAEDFDGPPQSRGSREDDVDPEEEKSKKQGLLLEARTLRSELTKWKHQASVLEGNRPQQEAEIARLKAEVATANDYLETTRHTVRHLEVEQGLAESEMDRVVASSSSSPRQNSGGGNATKPTRGGLGSVDAKAEKRVRQIAEGRSADLSSKTKRLSTVLAAQKLLIQRLEKQLAKEGGFLEQREMRLSSEVKLHGRLKVALRQQSDEVVVATVLGKLAGVKAPKKKKPQFVEPEPGLCSDGMAQPTPPLHLNT